MSTLKPLSELYTPELFGKEQGWQAPRHDLTPDDLATAGWFIHPHHTEGQWVARRGNQAGGCEYTAPFKDLEKLVKFVRVNKIALLPWTEGY